MDAEARRRRKIGGVLRATGGLVLILLVLPTLSLVGVTRFTLEKWSLHLAFTLALQGTLLLALHRGWDQHLRWDPHFLFVPMLAAAASFNSCVLLAPELRQLVLVTWFVAVLFMVGLAGFVEVVALSMAMAGGYLAVAWRLKARGVAVSIAFEATFTAAFLVSSLYAGVVFERLRRERQERRALRRQLAELAATDDLTGLPNRRQFDALLAAELARTQRHGSRHVLAMVDVDSFKNYNDHLGHPAGDALLRELATLMRAQLRGVDVVARYGGEEFGIIMPGTSGEQARLSLDRIREVVAQHPFARREVQPGGALTISAGYAACPDDAASVDGLKGLADEALYRAKHLGRNRVEGATPGTGEGS
jgi:diguanylate cyclase (GGDEF)-like protein